MPSQNITLSAINCFFKLIEMTVGNLYYRHKSEISFLFQPLGIKTNALKVDSFFIILITVLPTHGSVLKPQ